MPRQVKMAARMSGRDAKISLGPAVVLFDATRPADLLDMDTLGNLVVTQLGDADVLAISKADAVDSIALDEAAEMVREHNSQAEILNLSSFNGMGLQRLQEIILNWEDKG